MAATKETTPYRLGLDVGSGSVGWAMIALDEQGKPCGVIDAGSRIFGPGRDPKSLASLAADRRQARQARRRRDRYKARQRRLIHELVAAGLMPDDVDDRAALKALDPYELRHRGLNERLDPYEVGRALFHLQQRRGFQSNRKADRGNDEKSAMKAGIRDLEAAIGQDQTLGSYLYERMRENPAAGARTRPIKMGSKNSYEFYVDRSMVKAEFNRLWESQARFHPTLMSEQARHKIFSAIFDQRPLKPVDPGRCTLEPDTEKRAPLALASSQLFRMYQEVNALRVQDDHSPSLRARSLTREERDRAIEYLKHRASATLNGLKSAVFGKGSGLSLTLEAGERTKILGDLVSSELAKSSVLGPRWLDFSLEEQDAITRVLHDADSDDQVVELLGSSFGFTEEEARAACEAHLPEGYLRLSQKAVTRILPHLINGWDEKSDSPLTYDKAVVEAGYASHSNLHSGEIYDLLPYYGKVLRRFTQDLAHRGDPNASERSNPDELEFGRIANPTVHIGLNQVRLVVNALVRRYGPPAEIHVELARDLGQSAKARNEAASLRARNEKANDDLRLRLQALGQRDSYSNRERLKLYDELAPLNQVCVLCGERIELSRLFQPGTYEVDHILPFSRTLDDSFSNKHLIHTQCNRFKGNRSPWEAYGAEDEWPEILHRAQAAYVHSKAKFMRFAEDAMDKYSQGGEDFIARQLNDTRYMARMVKEYLSHLHLSGGDGFHPERVLAIPGRLTGMLRAKWGLNDILSDSGKKERSDHRHHAVDAIVIALSDRSTLKAVTDANKRAEQRYAASNDEGVKKLLDDLPEPWHSFTTDVKRVVDRIVVSHRPDHNEKGRLHEETAWGVLEGPDKDGRFLVHNKENPPKWRPMVPIYRKGEGPDSALPYKAYVGGSNYCIEVVQLDNGKWKGEVISTFEANQKPYQAFMRDRSVFLRESFSGRKLVMRLVAGDTIAVGEGRDRRIMRLCKIDSSGAMYFAEVHEGNVDRRARDKDDDFSMLKKNSDPLRALRARRVFVDPIGLVHDPGFRE